MRESHHYWVERSRDEEKKHAILQNVRELLLRLRQKRCAFAHDRLNQSICLYDERLENIGCAHPEVDEGEGPEILSAAGFILRDISVMTDDERIEVATVAMESRHTLQDLDETIQRGRWTLPVLNEGQDMVMMRKEAMRQKILGRIAEFLGKSA